MSKELKPIPNFASEDEEREFWAAHSSTDFIDWSKAEVIKKRDGFPNLKRPADTSDRSESTTV